MLRTILLCTLLLLAGCQAFRKTSGSDNDSPIVIADTSNILKTDHKAPLTIDRQKVSGSNKPYQKTPDGKVYFHDRSGFLGLTHHAASCLVLDTGAPILLGRAKSWNITFRDAGQAVLSFDWNNGDKDVALTIPSPNTINGEYLTVQAKFNTVEWTIDPTPGGPTTGGPTTSYTATIHYCPKGNCILNGNDPCKTP